MPDVVVERGGGLFELLLGGLLVWLYFQFGTNSGSCSTSSNVGTSPQSSSPSNVSSSTSCESVSSPIPYVPTGVDVNAGSGRYIEYQSPVNCATSNLC